MQTKFTALSTNRISFARWHLWQGLDYLDIKQRVHPYVGKDSIVTSVNGLEHWEISSGSCSPHKDNLTYPLLSYLIILLVTFNFSINIS